MDARASRSTRSSRHAHRLLLRVHSGDGLRHVSSQGTYCKVSVGNDDGGSSRASLKRFLPLGDHDSHALGSALLPRVVKTRVQKALRSSSPVWKESFEIPVFDPLSETVSFRIKSARLMTAPSIGAGAITVREIPQEVTMDRWINLFDNSKRPAGRLRIQVRLLPPASDSSWREHYEGESHRHSLSRHSQSHNNGRLAMPGDSPVAPPLLQIKTTRQPGAASGGIIRRTAPLSQSLVEASRASASTNASDSISSDHSNGRMSVPVVSPYPMNDSFGPASPAMPFGHAGSSPAPRATSPYYRDTRHGAMSSVSRGTTSSDDLDDLASKYMRATRTTQQQSVPLPPTVPEQPVEESPSASPVPASTLNDRSNNNNSAISTTSVKSGKEGSPRTTNTTALSSDEDEPTGDMTIEFDFDTGDVRPSTRLPAHMMRSTLSRASIATSRIESDEEETESEDEAEDDELDPDGDPDGPRMFLRSTVMKVLGRDSVNVIMDEEEEDDFDDEVEVEPFIVEELPILDFSRRNTIEDVDCADGKSS